MARIRTIKPEFWCDEKLSPLSPIDRLTFLGLISMADDYGRVHDNVKIIDAFVFPNTDDSVRESLANLSRIVRINRGISSSGMPVIEIVNWEKHQRVDKPQPKLALPKINVDQAKNGKKPRKNGIPELVANDSGTVRELVAPLTPTPTPTPTPIIKSAEAGQEYSEDFLKFWDSYPRRRRTKKLDAYQSWLKSTVKADPQLLIARAGEYARSKSGLGEYAVMPSVWLNSGMWNDEPEAWGGLDESLIPDDYELFKKNDWAYYNDDGKLALHPGLEYNADYTELRAKSGWRIDRSGRCPKILK